MKPIIAIPAIGALVYRARSKNSLTPGAIVVAVMIAIAHALHPWNMPFALLCVFFLAGTRATHIKEEKKRTLTLGSKGGAGGEGPRNATQVLANSVIPAVLCMIHSLQLWTRGINIQNGHPNFSDSAACFSWGGDVFIVGIIANYAAVAADTLSSELGILSSSSPRLITSLNLRKVPPGTNGGVTPAGLAAGLFGSILIVTTAMLFTPLCNETTAAMRGGGTPWLVTEKQKFMLFMVFWGFMGTIVDSVLGGLLQRTVKDLRTGKVVEGEGGGRALVSSTNTAHRDSEQQQQQLDVAGEPGMPSYAQAAASGTDKRAGAAPAKSRQGVGKTTTRQTPDSGVGRPSRVVENGADWLDNNGVNFVMAILMSGGAMLVAGLYWGIPIVEFPAP